MGRHRRRNMGQGDSYGAQQTGGKGRSQFVGFFLARDVEFYIKDVPLVFVKIYFEILIDDNSFTVLKYYD